MKKKELVANIHIPNTFTEECILALFVSPNQSYFKRNYLKAILKHLNTEQAKKHFKLIIVSGATTWHFNKQMEGMEETTAKKETLKTAQTWSNRLKKLNILDVNTYHIEYPQDYVDNVDEKYPLYQKAYKYVTELLVKDKIFSKQFEELVTDLLKIIGKRRKLIEDQTELKRLEKLFILEEFATFLFYFKLSIKNNKQVIMAYPISRSAPAKKINTLVDYILNQYSKTHNLEVNKLFSYKDIVFTKLA